LTSSTSDKVREVPSTVIKPFGIRYGNWDARVVVASFSWNRIRRESPSGVLEISVAVSSM
jgi:hypothetical protein